MCTLWTRQPWTASVVCCTVFNVRVKNSIAGETRRLLGFWLREDTILTDTASVAGGGGHCHAHRHKIDPQGTTILAQEDNNWWRRKSERPWRSGLSSSPLTGTRAMTSQLSTWTSCYMADAGHVTTEDYVTAPQEEAMKASKASVKFGQYMTPKGGLRVD